jgi:hypothetical protein
MMKIMIQRNQSLNQKKRRMKVMMIRKRIKERKKCQDLWIN